MLDRKLKSWVSSLLMITLLLTVGGPLLAKKKKNKDDVKEGDEATETWDVQAPGGPVYQADLDTHRGTWMNLDVSPDGKEDRLRSAGRPVRNSDCRRPMRSP